MNVGLSKIVVLAIVILVVASPTFPQSKSITEAEYWAGIRSAYSSSRKIFPRRETDVYERFSDGVTTYSRIKRSEYHAADKFHIVTETLSGGKKSVKEMIQVGTLRYCKENEGVWTSSGCYVNPPAPLEDALESSFAIQMTKDGVIFSRTSSYLSNESGKTEPVKFRTEDTTILYADLSVRYRSIVRSVYEINKIVIREMQKYEYGMNPKPIEVPIR